MSPKCPLPFENMCAVLKFKAFSHRFLFYALSASNFSHVWSCWSKLEAVTNYCQESRWIVPQILRHQRLNKINFFTSESSTPARMYIEGQLRFHQLFFAGQLHSPWKAATEIIGDLLLGQCLGKAKRWHQKNGKNGRQNEQTIHPKETCKRYQQNIQLDVCVDFSEVWWIPEKCDG